MSSHGHPGQEIKCHLLCPAQGARIRIHPGAKMDHPAKVDMQPNKPAEWEIIALVCINGNKWRIKSPVHNTYLRTSPGVPDAQVDNTPNAGEWEAYEVVDLPNGLKAFRSLAHNTYLSARGSHEGAPLRAVPNCDAWEHWVIERM